MIGEFDIQETKILRYIAPETIYEGQPIYDISGAFRSGYIVNVLPKANPGSAFIKRDQLDPWIKGQIKITLLPTILHLQLPNFVSCGRACPSHMTQNLVTVGAKLWTAERFLVDP